MKYKLTKKSKVEFGIKLFQIEATASFGIVSKGEMGGWVEKENNLSQNGNAWVSGDAQVYGDAQVSGNAQVYGDAQVYDDAQVYGNAQVYGDAQVSGNAQVYGKLKLLAGYFFGIRYQKEEIKFIKVDDDYELIYKGEAKFGDDESEKKNELLKKAEELLAEAESRSQ